MLSPQKSLVTSLLVVLLLAVTGCGGQSDTEPRATRQSSDQFDQAFRLIDEVTAHAEKSAAIEAQSDRQWDDVLAIDLAAANAADALPMLAELKTVHDKLVEDEKSALMLIDKVTTLDVSKELKTWAGQQKEISQLTLQEFAAEIDLVAKLQVVYDESRRSNLGRAERDELDQALYRLTERIQALRQEVREKSQASEQYWFDAVQNAYKSAD